mmetsp:Transcript_3559/g.10731  ORF Transcript_3559/g.10731 Transcript_3559/m.10731 type:complete len:331 (+) Transcript_3559:71-1063(+)
MEERAEYVNTQRSTPPLSQPMPRRMSTRSSRASNGGQEILWTEKMFLSRQECGREPGDCAEEELQKCRAASRALKEESLTKHRLHRKWESDVDPHKSSVKRLCNRASARAQRIEENSLIQKYTELLCKTEKRIAELGAVEMGRSPSPQEETDGGVEVDTAGPSKADAKDESELESTGETKSHSDTVEENAPDGSCRENDDKNWDRVHQQLTEEIAGFLSKKPKRLEWYSLLGVIDKRAQCERKKYLQGSRSKRRVEFLHIGKGLKRRREIRKHCNNSSAAGHRVYENVRMFGLVKLLNALEVAYAEKVVGLPAADADRQSSIQTQDTDTP